MAGYALVAVALAVVVLAVYGLLRLPDVYMQVHAAGKAAALGVIALLAASVATEDLATVGRAALVAGFLLITAPVGAHAIAAAARANDEPMRGSEAPDEPSGAGTARVSSGGGARSQDER